MKLYKILDNEGNSCHGGDANWDLPTKGVDRNWIPGEWIPEIEGKLELCVNGYHLCRTEDLLVWLNAAIYEAEYKGELLTGKDKIVVRKCRLLRKCEGWTEENARLFACWCVRHTPLADGRTTWDLLTDKRSRVAIETAERYAKGEVTKRDLNAAGAAARAGAGAAQTKELSSILEMKEDEKAEG